MRILLIAALLLATGCAVRQPVSRNWRFIKQDTSQFLIPPRATASLPQPNGRQTDPVDIVPPLRLQVVVTLGSLAPNVPIVDVASNVEVASKVDVASNNDISLNLTVRSSASLAGYETAWYALQPRSDGAGFTIVPLYAERNIQGAIERTSEPSVNYFKFEDDAAFYRLFYKAGQTDYTALVVAAPDATELDRRTRLLEGSAASCEKLDNWQCIAIPRRVAINPLLPIVVNGKEVMVSWRASVAEAIRTSGQRDSNAVLPTLTIFKTWKGRQIPVEFDRNGPAVLGLVLSGDETISFTR